MTNKPGVAHDLLHVTSTKHNHLRVNSSWRTDKSSPIQVLPDCHVFTNRCQWSICGTPQKVGVWDVVTLLNSQQMDGGQHRCQIISIKPPCSMCCVPIACLRSHRPTNPCWLHAHLPIHCTGNQLPRQPRSARACLSVKTNPILHFTCTTVRFSFIQSFMNLFLHLPVCFCEQTRCSNFNSALQFPNQTVTWHVKSGNSASHGFSVSPTDDQNE